MSAGQVTEAYRQQTLVLRARVLRDLLTLWPALDWAKLDSTFPAWLAAVTAIVQRDRATSSGLAAAYLAAFREASRIPGQPVVRLAGLAPAEQIETVARVTTVVEIKRAMAAGRSLERAGQAAFVLSAGDLSRLVLDAGRDTVRMSTVADPRSAGWRRVSSPRACEFCSMLADRGAVYTEATSGFETHGHCACSAEPVYH